MRYWLYVIYQYTDRVYVNIGYLMVAVDTHVVKASHHLGLISNEELNSSKVQLLVIEWRNDLLKDSDYYPIDIIRVGL